MFLSRRCPFHSFCVHRLTLDLSRSQSPSSHQYQNRPRSPSPNRYRSNRIHPECPPSPQQQAPANQQKAPLTQQQASPTQQQAQPTQQQPPPNQQQPPPTSALSGSQKAQLEFRGSCSGQVTPPAAAGVTMTTMIGNAGRHDSGSDVRSVATVTSEDGRKDQISSVGRARRKSLQDMKQQGVRYIKVLVLVKIHNMIQLHAPLSMIYVKVTFYFSLFIKFVCPPI